jgi:hypothetical protein
VTGSGLAHTPLSGDVSMLPVPTWPAGLLQTQKPCVPPPPPQTQVALNVTGDGMAHTPLSGDVFVAAVTRWTVADPLIDAAVCAFLRTVFSRRLLST